MRDRYVLAAILVWLCSTSLFSQHIAPTNALSPEDEQKSFTVPQGFEVQLVASEPVIDKPMQIAFDAKGRLWVTTSRHYPFATERGKSSDRLFVLSNFGTDGKAGKIQVFDDKLNIPIGILPLDDGKSCIVSSCGEILKLTDTDGDGQSDQRDVLFTGFGFKDTHGMTNSFTKKGEWIYACHGFANDSKVKGKDGHEIQMNSGHTFRFKPDGSRIEIFTKGQVNPFGMTTDRWDFLYTADCHSKPITQLIPGATYQSFSKPHDGLGFAPHVTKHDHGSTGLCGLVYSTNKTFPQEFQDCFFLGNVVTNKINCDKIEWRGSTPVAIEQPDFLTSTDPWFRPTDIKQGPDGALYVSDFYNKIIGHYEVDLKHPERDKSHGRIWRIVYKGPLSNKPAIAINPPDENSIASRMFVEAIVGKPQFGTSFEKLLKLYRFTNERDTHLIYAISIALRNCLDKNPDQLENSEIQFAYEEPKRSERIVSILLGLKNPEAMSVLARTLRFGQLPDAQRVEIASTLGRYGRPSDEEYLLAYLNDQSHNINHFSAMATNYLSGLQTQQASPGKGLASLVTVWCKKSIDSPMKTHRMAGLKLVAQLKSNEQAMFEMVAGRLARPRLDSDEQIQTCETLFALDAKDSLARLIPVLMNVDCDVSVRERAAGFISTNREKETLALLAGSLKTSPNRLTVRLASALAADRAGAKMLIDEIKQGHAPAAVLLERSVNELMLANLERKDLATMASLTASLPTFDAKINAIIKNRIAGYRTHKSNIEIGRELLTKNCLNCHALAGKGGKVGPNLDGIGTRGLDRLMEDILDPNRNIDHAFRATKLMINDGRELTGLLVREEGEVVVLADGEGKEQRITKATIEKKVVLNSSPMPSNWAEKLKEAELYEILGVLLKK